jgi:hypothetical protein
MREARLAGDLIILDVVSALLELQQRAERAALRFGRDLLEMILEIG